MNLDGYGLPVQADGDANDQLQRIGMIMTGIALGGDLNAVHDFTQALVSGTREGAQELDALFEPAPGVFVRHPGASPDNVSADQLVSILGANVLTGQAGTTRRMFKAMIKRFGFAQNYKDGLNESTRVKIPDFMLFRAMPLFARASKWLYPIAFISDLYLLVLAIGAIIDRNPDHTDDNNTILTLAVCRAKMPTVFSILAIAAYSKLRPWNYGCAIHFNPSRLIYSPVYGALRWYHRAEAGGNPEIAQLWKPIINKYFGGA